MVLARYSQPTTGRQARLRVGLPHSGADVLIAPIILRASFDNVSETSPRLNFGPCSPKKRQRVGSTTRNRHSLRPSISTANSHSRSSFSSSGFSPASRANRSKLRVSDRVRSRVVIAPPAAGGHVLREPWERQDGAWQDVAWWEREVQVPTDPSRPRLVGAGGGARVATWRAAPRLR